MKKFLLLMLVVWTGIVSSCKYDDEELWGGVDDLANRISAMEALTKQMNGDIAAIQAIVTALENRVSVSEVEKLTDGYILHFTNGKTVTIKNGADGKNGEDGKDAPVVGFGQEDGEYYWTLTVDGKTEWLRDEAGNRLPVSDREGGKDGEDGATGATGADGKTPKLMVDEEGYWMVSYDGTNYKPITNESGEKVSAIGAKEGEPFFKEVTESEDQETITIVMNDDEEYVLPLLKAIQFFTDEDCTIPADIKNIPWNGTAEKMNFYYELNLTEYSFEVVDEPSVPIEVDRENKKVTVSLEGNVVQDARAVVLFFNKTRTLTAVFKFVVAPWDGVASAEVTPDENGVYGIATPAHLKWIADQVNGGNNFQGKTVKLLNDIDLNNQPWTPIGQDSDHPFSGTFEGNFKTIKGLSVGATEEPVKGAGLFGVVSGATFRLLTITDAVVKPGEAVAGAGVLAGYVCASNTHVVNCVVENSIVAATVASGSQVSVGGIIGVWEKKAGDSLVDITGCTVDGMELSVSSEPETTDASVSVGGILGSLKVDDGLSYEVYVISNSVSHTQIIEIPSAEADRVISTQGPIVGNLTDLDTSVSVGIIQDNEVSEEVQIGTQLSVGVGDLQRILDSGVLREGGVYKFNVKGRITQETPLIIPSVGADVTLDFSDGGDIVIHQGSGDVTAEAINKLTIHLPKQDNGLRIYVPQTVVTLASGTYGAIDALIHTLIVGKEASVMNMDVEDGDVEVYGNITNLHRASGSTSDVLLTIFEGGTVGNIKTEGFIVKNEGAASGAGGEADSGE